MESLKTHIGRDPPIGLDSSQENNMRENRQSARIHDKKQNGTVA